MPSSIPVATVRIEPDVKRDAVAIKGEEPQPERERERVSADALTEATADGRWS